MKKEETDKARARLITKIKRGLKAKKTARQISEETGYTTSRVYQIKKGMIEAGELEGGR